MEAFVDGSLVEPWVDFAGGGLGTDEVLCEGTGVGDLGYEIAI